MVEEEAHQIEEEEAGPDQSSPGEEAADIEMVDQEELGDPESSGPHMEADTKDNPPVEIPFPQRRKRSSWVKHPNLRIWQLDLTAPGARPPQSQEGWLSYVLHPQATLGLRRGRPRNRSLPSPTYPEVLCLSPPSPQKKEVGMVVRRGT